MAKVSVTTVLTGVPQLRRALQLTDAGTRDRTKVALSRGAHAVARQAQQRAPKVTGELAQSIRAEEGKDGMVWFVKEGFGKLLRSTKATTTAGLARYEKVRARHQAQREKFRAAKSSKQALASLQLGVYAPVVERGDRKRNKPARPHLYPALAHERGQIQREVAAAPIKAGRAQGIV